MSTDKTAPWKLSADDSKAFVDALINPPEPNEALKEAAARHKSADLPALDVEEYLGDGLYVSFDGFGIRLRAPRDGRDHYVVLDPDVFGALLAWIERHPRLAPHLERSDR